MNLVIHYGNCSLELASGYALLSPDLSFFELPFSVETGHFGASACATWRTVIGFARTKHKIYAVYSIAFRGSAQLNMIYLLAARAGNSSAGQCLPNSPGKFSEDINIVECQSLTMIIDEEKPVSTPGHVAGNRTNLRNIHGYICSQSITGHIRDRNVTFFIEAGFNRSHRSFNAMSSRFDPIQIVQRGDNADRSVPAHSQVANVIEKDGS